MRFHVIPLLAVVLLAAAPLLVAQTTDSAAIMLETAKSLEVIDGDLRAAIKQYQAIVETFETDRAVVATALVHIAECYQKLGEPDARNIYQRVLYDYADQAEPAAEARGRLAALEVEPTPPSPTMTVREVMRSGPVQLGEIQAVPTTAPAVSADGHVLVYTDWSTGDLARLNRATGEVNRLFDTDWDATRFSSCRSSRPTKSVWHSCVTQTATTRGAPGSRSALLTEGTETLCMTSKRP